MGRLSIGIDGYNLVLPNGTGVARYGHVLGTILAARGDRTIGVFGLDAGADPEMAEVAFFEALGRPGDIGSPLRRRQSRLARRKALLPILNLTAGDVPLTGRVEIAPLADRLPPFERIVTRPRLFDIAHRHFARYGRFVRLRMPGPPAIMHWTYPVPIMLEGARNIYTLHDIVPLRLPYTTLDAKRRYRRLLAGCLARADAIATVSDASRADILAEFDVDPDRIVTTWQSSPPPPGALDRPAAEDAASIANIFGLADKGYFLFAGAIEPKKNIGRLIEAYLSLGTETPLVMVGGRSWSSERELMLLEQAGLGPDHASRLARRVIRLDHLSRDLLVKLMRGARALVFPSLSEGFGLPVLEAMQLGTPVLTSTAGSLPEVAGDAALLVDPYSVEAIAAGVRALDSDSALRTRLAVAGLAQAARFSTAAYGERLDRLYARALADTRPRAD